MENGQSRTEQENEGVEDSHKERISLEKCSTILKAKEHNWTELQIQKIRDFLYLIAEIDYQFQCQNKLKTSDSKQQKGA